MYRSPGGIEEANSDNISCYVYINIWWWLWFQVTIYFNNKLLRGNRASKVDSGSFDAFHTPNLSPLAELEIDIYGEIPYYA